MGTTEYVAVGDYAYFTKFNFFVRYMIDFFFRKKKVSLRGLQALELDMDVDVLTKKKKQQGFGLKKKSKN